MKLNHQDYFGDNYYLGQAEYWLKKVEWFVWARDQYLSTADLDSAWSCQEVADYAMKLYQVAKAELLDMGIHKL